jgi:hypothetical protein
MLVTRIFNRIGHNICRDIKVTVTNSKEGVCVDPGEKGEIYWKPGDPPGGGKGWQLASDSGGEET